MNALLTGFWLLGILGSVALGSSPGHAAETLTLQDGKLTARIGSLPLRQVMAELGRLTGTQVRWLGEAGVAPVSGEFTALPLHEAIGRIVRENFVLVYAPGGDGTQLAEIWIGSRGKDKEPVQLPDEEIVPQRGRRPAPPAPGMEIDLAEEPPAVRLEAVHLLAPHAERDELAKEILSDLAQRDRDPRVKAMAAQVLEGMR